LRVKIFRPGTWSDADWPWNLAGSSNRPMRGPRMAAATKAAMPPVMCTTPEPAKSIMPDSMASGLKAERKPYKTGGGEVRSWLSWS